MVVTWGKECDNDLCQYRYDGVCTVDSCSYITKKHNKALLKRMKEIVYKLLYIFGFHTSDHTEMTINNQDNKTTKIESDYIICPHCGEKIYK